MICHLEENFSAIARLYPNNILAMPAVSVIPLTIAHLQLSYATPQDYADDRHSRRRHQLAKNLGISKNPGF
jgi:hypothetical protein